jgi:hypothetical protein
MGLADETFIFRGTDMKRILLLTLLLFSNIAMSSAYLTNAKYPKCFYSNGSVLVVKGGGCPMNINEDIPLPKLKTGSLLSQPNSSGFGAITQAVQAGNAEGLERGRRGVEGLLGTNKKQKPEYCKNVHNVATGVMERRQQGESLPDLMDTLLNSDVSKGGKQLGEKLILMAFNIPVLSKKQDQEKEVKRFANEVALKCYSKGR